MSIFDSPSFNQSLFFPRPDQGVCPPGCEDIFIEVKESILLHARCYIHAEARFSLLYFHGNGEVVADYDSISTHFSKIGLELTVCDYRGYGRSNGTPTLRGCLEDSHKVYESLQKQGKLREQVIIMGRSLGSAPAIELAAHAKGIRACIIESGSSDPFALARRRGIVLDYLSEEEDRVFNNGRKITDVTIPLLIMHGENDCLILPEEAEMNFQKASSLQKYLEILPNVGHNDILFAADNAYFSCLEKFLQSLL